MHKHAKNNKFSFNSSLTSLEHCSIPKTPPFEVSPFRQTTSTLTSTSKKKSLVFTNNIPKKPSKNLQLLKMKKEIFSKSVLSQSPSNDSQTSSPQIVSKRNKKDSTNSNNKTSAESSTYRSLSLSKNVSNFNPYVNRRSQCSDECIKFIEHINSLKELCSFGSLGNLLSSQYSIGDEIELSRQKSTPTKMGINLKSSVERDMVLLEIDNIFNSIKKNRSFHLDESSLTYDHNNSSSDAESENRMRIYSQLFAICKERVNQINEIILGKDKIPKEDRLIRFNTLDDESNDSLINEGVEAFKLPSQRVVAVNFVKRKDPNSKIKSPLIDSTVIATIIEEVSPNQSREECVQRKINTPPKEKACSIF